jgi:hypothetical protein
MPWEFLGAYILGLSRELDRVTWSNIRNVGRDLFWSRFLIYLLNNPLVSPFLMALQRKRHQYGMSDTATSCLTSWDRIASADRIMLSRFRGVPIDRIWIGYWIYWHYSELQVITAPPLMSTLFSSLWHPLYIFQPVVSWTAVLWQRLLTVEILHLPALIFSSHNRPCRTQFPQSPELDRPCL